MASNTDAAHINSSNLNLNVDMSFLDKPLPIDWSKLGDHSIPPPLEENIFDNNNMSYNDISFCQIICENFVVKSKFVSCSPCSHIFCDECLEFYFTTYQTFHCPLCKEKIDNLSSLGKDLRSMVIFKTSKIIFS